MQLTAIGDITVQPMGDEGGKILIVDNRQGLVVMVPMPNAQVLSQVVTALSGGSVIPASLADLAHLKPL